MSKALNPIFKVLLCVCALSVSGAGAAYAGPKEDAIAAYDEGDYKRAARLFEPLAKHGDALAQFKLGFMYTNGDGVLQDYKEGMKWYRLSAEQGNAEAQNFLGGMYVNGQGVVRDNVYAYMWFNIAASSGDANAVKNRDNVASEMTAPQLEKAQDLARECVKKNYKGC